MFISVLCLVGLLSSPSLVGRLLTVSPVVCLEKIHVLTCITDERVRVV